MAEDVTRMVRDAVESNRIVLGTESAANKLKLGKLEAVVVASNCPENVRNDLEHNAKVSGTKVLSFDGKSSDLGALCRKPFTVIVAGITKSK